jgi:hypothetical protein
VLGRELGSAGPSDGASRDRHGALRGPEQATMPATLLLGEQDDRAGGRLR